MPKFVRGSRICDCRNRNVAIVYDSRVFIVRWKNSRRTILEIKELQERKARQLAEF